MSVGLPGTNYTQSALKLLSYLGMGGKYDIRTGWAAKRLVTPLGVRQRGVL